MSGNIKVHNIKICCHFHGIGKQLSCNTFQNISINNLSVVHSLLFLFFFYCFSFAFLTNFLNQSDFIVSQPYSEQFALLIVLAHDYDI